MSHPIQLSPLALMCALVLLVAPPSVADEPREKTRDDETRERPAKRVYTNADLPKDTRVSVLGTLTIADGWDDMSRMPVYDVDVDAPPPPRTPPPNEERDRSRRDDAERLPDWLVIGVRTGYDKWPCLYGRCRDGSSPLEPAGTPYAPQPKSEAAGSDK
jgi:hypothetical protein